jgi:hypothetical protein
LKESKIYNYIKEGLKMERTRFLNDEEKCELINALANAKNNNAKKSKAFKGDAESAHHPEDKADLKSTSERFDLWAQLDDALIEAITEGKLVMVDEEDE